MFQFPGFAFLTLCIQVKNTWFTLLLITLAGNNNRISGGLPHSEIHGSKLILSSPWLIAEYHVFHRLLLPRHSPNALFALDLIQKKKDFIVSCRAERYLRTFTCPSVLPVAPGLSRSTQKLVRNCAFSSEIKSILFPAWSSRTRLMNNVAAHHPCGR